LILTDISTKGALLVALETNSVFLMCNAPELKTEGGDVFSGFIIPCHRVIRVNKPKEFYGKSFGYISLLSWPILPAS